jgi:hypothetical protein
MDFGQANRLFSETETILVIDNATFFSLRRQIVSCEQCRPGDAEVSVEMILDAITSSDPTRTSYFIGSELLCPRCLKPIDDEGLVEWDLEGAG